MKLNISQIILESAKFAHIEDFLSRPATPTPPPSEVNLEVSLHKAEDGKGAMVRLRALSDSPNVPYMFDVSYLVLLVVELEDGESAPPNLERRILLTGANMAFPFVRECVANITTRGRFGPSWLAPVNFGQIVSEETPPTAEAVPPPEALSRG